LFWNGVNAEVTPKKKAPATMTEITVTRFFFIFPIIISERIALV
jgi:hypothetical protein